MTNYALDLLFARERAADELEDQQRTCLRLPTGAIWSYGALRARSFLYAEALSAHDVRPGDRVLVQVQKSPDAVALYLAALAVGAVYVPLNVAYTGVEVEYFLADARAKLVVVEPSRLEALRGVAARAGAGVATLDESSWADPPSRAAEKTVWLLDQELPSCVDAADAADWIMPRGDDDLAAIVYTSGTTGRSKGAMLTHANLRSNAQVLCDCWEISAHDVLLHALPIFHVHGLFVALHTLLMKRGQVVFLPKFAVDSVREQLPGATLLMGVPTFYTRLLEEGDFGQSDCESMRLFISGSAPLLATTHDDFAARTGHRVLERYGMSEAGMITSNPLRGERRAGTVGFALPGVQVRVCDAKSGLECQAGEIGSVEVRGPNVFKGYWEQPEKTAAEHREDGFFVTGDLGFLDAEGRLTLIGRGKDLVIAGGYNIYPKEIEATLDRVEGVLESAVIGVPHADLGEGVVAVLVAESEPIEDSVLQAVLDTQLARFKHPRRFFWRQALPRNAMGKVQKNVLREEHADAFGSRAQ